MAVDVDNLVARAREGQPRAVARLISFVEDSSPLLREVTAALAPYAGRAHVIGLTGAPGVGKSTSTSAIVTRLRARDLRLLYDAPKRGTAGSRVNFVHPKDCGGVLVELVQAAADPH